MHINRSETQALALATAVTCAEIVSITETSSTSDSPPHFLYYMIVYPQGFTEEVQVVTTG